MKYKNKCVNSALESHIFFVNPILIHFYCNPRNYYLFQGVLSFPAFATHDEALYNSTKDTIMQNLVNIR